MKNKTMNLGQVARPAALATAIALALGAAPVHAIEFQRGELRGNINTTVSYGAAWRVQSRDDDLVAKSHFNPLISQAPLEQQIAARGRFSANSDDGNLNYDRGDMIQGQARITSEMELNYRRSGAFVRANYFYDHVNNRKDELTSDAQDIVGERFRLLDAYVFSDFDVGDRLLNLRLGRQVVSWGESTFIQGGMNTINPVDVAQIRTAGAELRDAFLPINMLWGSIDLTQDVSLEALYMFEWEEVEPEPGGTFFATNDFATPGGRYAMLNFGLVPQPVHNADLFDEVCGQGNFAASDTGLPPALVGAGCQAALPRAQDNKARDQGQFGLALRYFSPFFGQTEFGLYYLRYHSRLPVLSGQAVSTTAPSSGRVIVEYPEDINLFGLSFNTTVAGGWALGGEVTYRDNVPLQIDDVELLFAGLSPLNAVLPDEANRFRSQLGEYGPGEYIQGWERHELTQIQTTATRLFGPGNFLNADQVAVVGEIGATKIWDLPDWDVLRYEGPGTDTGGGPSQQTGGNLRNPVTTRDGFATSFSWGYRLVVAPTYNNAFGTPWNVTPRLAFNHDVNGVTPGPGGNFVEGRKSYTLGVGASYLGRWNADVAYTSFFGAGNRNLLGDRDFVGASVSYSF